MNAGVWKSPDRESLCSMRQVSSTYAMDDTCAHRAGPLGDGSLDGTIVTCPWHGWKYDVSTGACQAKPRIQLTCYEVRVNGDDVTIALG